jgi:cytochrome d ubiquinol oxidase subunit I
MFFGWSKVSKRFHLVSSWLVAIGASLSALWIIVANGWMQYPVGMVFNPDTARNEMVNFWDVLFNKIAIYDFLHTISSGFLVGSMFVVGISAWYLLRKREAFLASRSILVAGLFGLLSSLLVAFTGDLSAKIVSKVQPVKFASMEAFYDGQKNPGLVAFGVLKESEKTIGKKKVNDFAFKIEIPGLLSIMTGVDRNTFIPGINDLVKGNAPMGVMSVSEKMQRGKTVRDLMADYKTAKQNNQIDKAKGIAGMFRDRTFIDNYFRYFGYSFIDKPEDVVPNVKLTFYTFHLMVILGFYFILLFIMSLCFLFRGTIGRKRWFLWILLCSILLPYVAGEIGWVLTEMGRHPWIIQDLMPVSIGVSQIGTGSVITTFILFAVLFTILLVAEISIMIRQIKLGPKH